MIAILWLFCKSWFNSGLQNSSTKFQGKTKNEFHCGLIFLQPVTETDVVNCLHSLDTSKSTGLHEIPIKFLKLATTVVAPILAEMFNCCIQEELTQIY